MRRMVDESKIASTDYVDKSVTGLITQDEAENIVADYVQAHPARTLLVKYNGPYFSGFDIGTGETTCNMTMAEVGTWITAGNEYCIVTLKMDEPEVGAGSIYVGGAAYYTGYRNGAYVFQFSPVVINPINGQPYWGNDYIIAINETGATIESEAM